MGKVLFLRAKPVKKGDLEICYRQNFEYWDDSDKKWKLHDVTSDTLFKQREIGKDLFEQWLQEGATNKYDEIHLQPLRFSLFEKSVKLVESLIDKKANGLAVMRQFWGGGLVWVPHEETRLRWKYDKEKKEMYTIFEKGKSTGHSVPPFFQPNVDANQTELEGLNLTGLKLKTKDKDDSVFPRKLNYTVCIRCELDGIRKATNFRGAHLRQTRFCGISKLNENDLTSTICWETHFDFSNKNIRDGVKKFKDICLDEASFIDTANFDFKDSDFQNNTAVIGEDYGSSLNFFKRVSKSRDTLSKHKSELAYVVDELERLRKYEAKKDNWQEIIDSWISFRKMQFKTKKAVEIQNYLFELDDSKKLFIIGKVLYSMDDEPPYGLLAKIKKHVGKTILRNPKYYEEITKLRDEIENINSILLSKDRFETTFQNLVLGFFIFFFTIGANIVSEEIKEGIENFF
eukprot:CAMPEP_0194085028 /NCGR_PEP_ID=MMETSP0149-20130528/16088_1 /TAXON_ID=122233 /ORGANISM="Chaetoceros debilis, Strain MM31A-1" /LENGTH=457 /DNA_ID=CAMNT_0038767825 /DNA_START=47 /DNA_END=1420 /DNA_ORIENTATION=+